MESLKYELIPVIAPKCRFRKTNYGSMISNLDNSFVDILSQTETLIFLQCTGKYKLQDILNFILQLYKSQNINEEEIISAFEGVIEKLYRKKQIFFTSEYINVPQLRYTDQYKDFSSAGKDLYNIDGIYSISIKIIDDCPLNCVYCSQSAPYSDNVEHIMEFEKVKKVLLEAYQYGARLVYFTGGEPLMYPNFCDLVRYARSIGYVQIYASTKATLIDEQYAFNLWAAGLNTIQVSVDSVDKAEYENIVGVKGSFEKMNNGIYALIATGIEVVVKSVVTKNNIEQIPNVVKYFSDMGIKKIGTEVVVPCGRGNMELLPSEKQILDFKQILEKISVEKDIQTELVYSKYGNVLTCSGLYTTLNILRNGDVIVCDKLDFMKDTFTLGNVFTTSIEEIWNSERYKSIRQLRKNNEVCGDCEHFLACGGGCMVKSKLGLGDINVPDPSCKLVYKESVSSYLYTK